MVRVAVALVAAGAALLMAAGCGGATTSSAPKPPVTIAASSASSANQTTAPPRRPDPAAVARLALARHTVHEGALPPTAALPSTGTRLFRALMAALWEGIASNDPARALPAFFPKGAYEQLKAIPGAGSDWSSRLVGDYGLDISAAHSLVVSSASGARLIGVDAVASYAHWVPPGVCYNSIGYYELPNARVVYSTGAGVRSFGIASLISWRGVWYVVHLGAVLRSSEAGALDAPESGRGHSEYSGTC